MTNVQIIDAYCNWELIWTKIMWYNSGIYPHMQFPEFVIFFVGKYHHKLHSRSFITIWTNEYIILDVGK